MTLVGALRFRTLLWFGATLVSLLATAVGLLLAIGMIEWGPMTRWAFAFLVAADVLTVLGAWGAVRGARLTRRHVVLASLGAPVLAFVLLEVAAGTRV